MYSAYNDHAPVLAERGDAPSLNSASDKYITIPHRNGETRVQVSIEMINKFGGSWSLECSQ